MDLALLDDLIGNIGPLDSSISAIVRDTTNSWIVRVGEVEVILEYDAVRGMLRLGTEIGVPAADAVDRIYEALLVYNVAGRETGDIVMALTAPGGSILQLCNLPAAQLTSATLVTPIVNLAARTLTWRDLVGAGLEGRDAIGGAPIGSHDGFIRV